MTDTDTHVLHGWRVRPAPPFAEDLAEATTVTRIGWSRGTQVQISGQCPYCFGEYSYVHPLQLVPSARSRPAGQGSGVIDITIECHCAHQHPNAPGTETGCGQAWTIEVRR